MTCPRRSGRLRIALPVATRSLLSPAVIMGMICHMRGDGPISMSITEAGNSTLSAAEVEAYGNTHECDEWPQKDQEFLKIADFDPAGEKPSKGEQDDCCEQQDQGQRDSTARPFLIWSEITHRMTSRICAGCCSEKILMNNTQCELRAQYVVQV
jgi:hypothetical protein